MSEGLQCRRFLVSGRVQGVFFRSSTRDRAMQLGLKGFARNLEDGRVEVHACGKRDVLAVLEEWLWQGPPMAQVNDVVVESLDDPACHESFVIFRILD